ncbi:MAG: DUF4241 domain-containing protein [Caldisericia bacterium]
MSKKISKRKTRKIWEQVGRVSVDSGQIVIVDPGFLQKSMIDELADINYDKPQNLYDHSCNIAGSSKSVGEFRLSEHTGMVTAVASETGIGDGQYPVYARFNKDNRVAELRIKFLK